MSLRIQSKSTILIKALDRCNMVQKYDMLRRVGVTTHEHIMFYKANPSKLEELSQSAFRSDRTNCVITKTEIKIIINAIDQIRMERTEQFIMRQSQCSECESRYEMYIKVEADPAKPPMRPQTIDQCIQYITWIINQYESVSDQDIREQLALGFSKNNICNAKKLLILSEENWKQIGLKKLRWRKYVIRTINEHFNGAYKLSLLRAHGKDINHCFYAKETKIHICDRKMNRKEEIYHVWTV